MVGAKFVGQANHVLSVLAAEHGWSRSQRELSQLTGIRPPLLSEIVRRLEQTGRVRRGEVLPGPGRQHQLVVVSAAPLTQADLRGVAVQDPPVPPRVADGGQDELGASVFNLLRELTERLSEAMEEARVSDQRLQDARQSRADDRIRSEAEILRLKDQIQDLDREIRKLRAEGDALPGAVAAQEPRRSIEELEHAARDMLEQLGEA